MSCPPRRSFVASDDRRPGQLATVTNCRRSTYLPGSAVQTSGATSEPRHRVGYILAERYWGQGLATEAVRPVIDWAYAQAELTRLWATCHPDNTRSARVLGKLGLVLEASRESLEPRPQLGELAGPSLVFARVKPAHAGTSAGTRGKD